MMSVRIILSNMVDLLSYLLPVEVSIHMERVANVSERRVKAANVI
jgi:hypothetical protein